MDHRGETATIEALQRPAAGGQGLYSRYRSQLRGGLAFVSVILLWEVVARYGLRDVRIFPPVSRVLMTLVELFVTGEIWKHLWVSSFELLLGFVLGGLAGIIAGFLMGTVRILREYLNPWISGLYSAPLVALAPFYIMFFGIGVTAKVALVFTVVLFPVAINTLAGVYSTDPGFVEVARSFSASRLQILFKVLVPFSLSHIVTGLRLGVGRGLTGVVVAEFLFANAGIGFLVALAGQTFNTSLLFAGVLIFAGAGVGLTAALKRIEKELAPWRRFEEG